MPSAIAEAAGSNNIGKRIGASILFRNEVLCSARHTAEEISGRGPAAYVSTGKNHRFTTVVAQTALAVICTQACLGNFLSHR